MHKKMKGLIVLVSLTLLIAIVSTLGLAGCGGDEETTATPTSAPTTPPEVYEWKLQGLSPRGTGDWVINERYEDWLEEISGGRLEITLYGSGEIVGPEDLIDALADGTLQIAQTYPGYYRGFIPEAGIAGGLPGVMSDVSQWYEVYYNRGLIDLMREAFAEHGVWYVGSMSFGSMPFWATRPIRTLEDFNGLKIRATGDTADLLETLGAATTYIPHEESYMALQLGTVDGYCSGYIAYIDFKHTEIAPYLMLPALQEVALTGYSISMDALNELPEDLRTIIMESAPQIFSWEHEREYHEVIANAQVLIPELGCEFVQMDDEVVQAMRAYGLEVLDKYAANSERSAKMVAIIKDYMEEVGLTQ